MMAENLLHEVICSFSKYILGGIPYTSGTVLAYGLERKRELKFWLYTEQRFYSGGAESYLGYHKG